MVKAPSGHGGEQSDGDVEHTRQRLEEYLGEALPNYLLSQKERQVLFGGWIKRIRQSKKRRAGSTGRQKAMSQASLATRCTLVWWKMFLEERSWDARWVRKLESGDVDLTHRLVACLLVALRATEYEAAMLLELAGYNGGLALLASRLGVRSTIIPDLQDDTQPYQPEEKAHLLELRILMTTKEIYRRLKGLPDLEKP